MSDLSNYLDIALGVVRKGESIFTKNISKYNQLEKNIGREVKIRADRELNDLLVEELRNISLFNIVSEEKHDNTIQENEYNWIVDPLDGSFNYLRGIPIYCISLGLWKGLEPVLGVIYDLTQNDIYYGIIGENAYKNKKKISVSRVNLSSDAVLCTGFPVNYSYSEDNILEFVDNVKKYKKIRLFGSAAMSLSLVASGIVDAYIEENIMVWDVAAGIAIVKAAGGNVEYSQGSVQNSFNVSVTNGSLPVNN
jgi:fructose-1,6-bisphosphatase/inositol monophosphatase family enzyme